MPALASAFSSPFDEADVGGTGNEEAAPRLASGTHCLSYDFVTEDEPPLCASREMLDSRLEFLFPAVLSTVMNRAIFFCLCSFACMLVYVPRLKGYMWRGSRF